MTTSLMIRPLSYASAINEALRQSMQLSDKVVVLGQLVDYKSGIFGTTTGLVDQFGPRRVQGFSRFRKPDDFLWQWEPRTPECVP